MMLIITTPLHMIERNINSHLVIKKIIILKDYSYLYKEQERKIHASRIGYETLYNASRIM